MSRRIAVKDSNIFIDMEYMGILDLWFQLGYETITSNLVVLELEEGQHMQALAYVKGGQIRELPSPLDMLMLYQGQYSGISAADAAVLHLAVEHEALLLSGDGKLRQSAHAESVPCHGSIWVLDQLVKAELLKGNVAAEKLSSLIALTGKQRRFLPEASAREYITRWRRMR